MLGAIAGDIIGSPYEGGASRDWRFPLFAADCRFTDDTVLTVATADSILNHKKYAQNYHKYFMNYPGRGYGSGFARWASRSGAAAYNSWGNGSAMRISPVGWAFNSLEKVLAEAKKSAEVTHNHPDGIKGAQAVAAAIFMGRSGASKGEIRAYIVKSFNYDLNRSIWDLRREYRGDTSCQHTVPEAIICFLGTENYEAAVRHAVGIGGDTDTLACMAGSIAEAFYGSVPQEIKNKVFELLDEKLGSVVRTFYEKFNIKG